jgi:hypothetical protein
MGLAWQQRPLALTPVGHILTPEPLPRLLFAEPLRRRMRVRRRRPPMTNSDKARGTERTMP